MSFLFKNKKSGAPSGSLPPGSRNIHTSDGTPTPDSQQGRAAPSPAPNAGPNSSMGSIQLPGHQGGPAGRRDRADSELGTRPSNLMQQVPHAALYPWSQRTLSFPSPKSIPFPRYGAAVNSTASKDGDIYMMGGLINGSSVKGDLWMVQANGGNLSCFPIATVSEGPGPRVGHSSLLVGNAFIVFGGDTKVEETDVLDDTLYLLNTTSRQWSRASPPGPKPAGRYGHTLNILGSKIYIFGGQVEGTFYNDLVAFDLNALQNLKNSWEFLHHNTSHLSEEEQAARSVPPARTNHTIIGHNDQLYLFGGTNGLQWFNDVWTYDPKTNRWTQLDCIGYIPTAREGHAAAIVNDVMYVFGGRNDEGNDLGDLAAFRISLRRWYTFQNMGPAPSPRSGHSMTTHGKQVVVLGGEPSTAPRDPSELSLAYILDTAKIRYPNDAPGVSNAQRNVNGPPSPTHRSSSEARNAIVMRSTSREGQNTTGGAGGPRSESAQGRDIMAGGPVQRPSNAPAPGPGSSNPPAQRGLKTSISQVQPGPPPLGQAPTPRASDMGLNAAPKLSTPIPPQEQPRSAPSEGPGMGAAPGASGATAPALASAAAVPASVPAIRETAKENRAPRDGSPGSQGRRTPREGSISKAKAMEAGEAAPLVGAGVARQRSLRSQKAHNSVDGSEDGVLGRSTSGRRRSDTPSEHRNSRLLMDEPKSPKVSPHQEALIKELEAAKRNNAWYTSELALAKKQGFVASTAPPAEDRATLQFSDEDRPLMEAFVTMRAELLRMQQNMEHQSSTTAKRIAEVEHQRDAAIAEAAYARAKLAAHGGSARSTPQLEGPRPSEDSERSTDISRRLALALAATSEHKAKIDNLNDQITAEKRAREAAEENARAAQRRLEATGSGSHAGEIEAIRAELHAAQSRSRSDAGLRMEAEQKLRLLEVDHADLKDKHMDVSSQVSDHSTSMATLEAAVAASQSKAGLYERQVQEERNQREALEQKLAQLRSQHELSVQELDSTSRKLRDAEELAESHAREATTHREALVSGLAKISNPTRTTSRDSLTERRLAALQEAADRANALAKSNQEAAETAAQKLRNAEERIAGLNHMQEQSIREELQMRRQLQAALRDVQTQQSQQRELQTQLESHQRDASALAVQHGALKDLLGERGIDMSNTRRSPGFDSPGSPDQYRLRELQQQLEQSLKAHEETKATMESSQQETERTFREKLEQLENDYQSLLTYVKGTEKMLKKMKEELAKYKTANQRLAAELDNSREGKAGSSDADPGAWAAERDALQSSIDSLKVSAATQISTLETNLAALQQELAAAHVQRDQQVAAQEQLALAARQKDKELTSLKSENSMLESRAADAEHRVTMLLDQVGQSIGDMRRRSQMPPPHVVETALNGADHNRDLSVSTITDTSSHAADDDLDHRGSLALDHLASELETLRSQWESTTRSYRTSARFEFDRAAQSDAHPAPLKSGLGSWRHQLDDDDEDAAAAEGSHAAVAGLSNAVGKAPKP